MNKVYRVVIVFTKNKFEKHCEVFDVKATSKTSAIFAALQELKENYDNYFELCDGIDIHYFVLQKDIN